MFLMFLKLIVSPLYCIPQRKVEVLTVARPTESDNRLESLGFAADFLPLQPLAETDTGTWYLH